MVNVYVLEVKFSFHGKEDTLYPVILQHSSETILVDCGYAGFMPLIEEAANRHGLSLQHLTGIIITHHDIDHMGGLHEIKEKYPAVKVYSLDTEEKYISGKAKSLRLQQAEAIFPTLPEDQQQGALGFQALLKNMKTVDVDITFSADKTPDFMEGIQIIHTPGHMPGHISIYLEDHKILIASDALVIEDGAFEIANPHFTLDLKEAVASVKKLSTYAIDEVICYHGGVMRDGIYHQLVRLLNKYAGLINNIA